MYRFLLAIFLPLVVTLTSAQTTLPDLPAVRAFSDETMRGIASEAISISSERLIPLWARIRPEFVRERVEILQAEERRIRGLFGKPLGFEFIGERRLGESLVRLTYVERLERAPVLWHMYFYRAKDKWELQSISYDEELGVLFRDLGK